MNEPLLRIRGLCFAHGGHAVLKDLDLDLEEGGILLVVGPSGSGKSTLLRTIAGLARPGAGSIHLGGRCLSNERTFILPEARSVGMVFQGLALFPHLTVAGNVGFGLHDLDRDERGRRVQEELRSVGLEGFERRYPHELSGGQQQRVAIARSLVMRPGLLLMDEPFSDLDSETRVLVRHEVRRILLAHGVTAIIVSHDPEDAVHLGARVARMENGRLRMLAVTDDATRGQTATP
ncbi:MAG: ABC transporter ATP-binding protein [Flavobacteriales bacterium]|nr:ABC transporter ATP-binding protein [Flavobacteriales bacterium]